MIGGEAFMSILPMEQTASRAAPCPPQLIGVPLWSRSSTDGLGCVFDRLSSES